MINSLWADTAKLPSFPRLEQDLKTDILIIGGGMAGLLCACALNRACADYALIEADSICSGVTRNTTAKITSQHGLIYDKLIREYDEETARLYYEANQAAISHFRKLAADYPCRMETKSAFVYTTGDSEKLEKELRALERIGAKARYWDSLPLPFDVTGAIEFEDQAQFHPLKFLYGIAEGLPVYENTKVLELMPGKAVTDRREISCRKMIVATHFPILNKHGGYYLKMYQHRSYVLALDGAADVGGMYVDESDKGLSFRNYRDLLLLGGGGHRTGKKGGNWNELEEFVRKHYKGATVVNQWATQDCMTLDGIPYIGQYSKNTPDLYVATGFNKWGMTSSMSAAMILTDIVCGKSNDYAAVFSPSRSMLRPQLVANAFESIVGLLTPTAPRCPHLGCALKYNAQEHSWDCPCHGSRFAENGQLIDNPATDDKKL